MNEERFLRIWAKTDKEDETSYHPLLFHMLDVAAVAGVMWDGWLPTGLKLRVGAALGLDDERARLAVVLLAGLHDLGKACPAFQRQVPRLFERLGLPDTDTPTRRPLHGFVTAKELIDRYGQPGLGWRADTESAYCLAAITGGHHGVFPLSWHLDRTSYKVARGSEEQWARARDRMVQAFLSAVAGEDLAAQELRTQEIKDPGIVPLLAGLISVVDWIGSAQEYFPPAARTDGRVPAVRAYARNRPKRAAKALEGFGWLPGPTAARPAPINEAFQYIKNFDANRMQRTVAEIAESQTGPYLLIVEEAMGRGKSEAGMYAFDRAFSEGRTHGLYVALPTMATGNAMYGRVREYLEKRRHGGRLNLQLIYGNALLNEEFAEVVFGDVHQEGSDPGKAGPAQQAAAEGAVSAAAWFTARKRPLLAPFGVGTIDQSLLGVLQTRHWFVRLFGLAGKVVVFDEVHSYDVYMLTELKLLIQWLRELDCTVILLSATLPSDRRRELVEAWGATPPDERTPYPRVTIASGGIAREMHVGEPSDLDRQVRLDFALPDPATLPQLVREHLPRGGCGVIICNTVDRAQQVYRALRDAFKPKGWRILLFHARMPLAWREEREKRVRELLGKNGDRSQPTLIIGTQVLEQSLDYDADWMASDIAPIDLLIQRMGRLWRHPKENPPERRPIEAPCFTVLCDGSGKEEPPGFENAAVYARYVLLRTWLAIRELDAVDLPNEIEDLIEQVYTLPAPSDLFGEWQMALDEASAKLAREQESARRRAEGCLAPEPRRPRRVLSAPSRDLDDDENPALHETVRALTRDAEPSITVVCLGTDEQGRALAIPVAGEVQRNEARALLRFSLPVRSQRLFHALAEEPVPSGWRKNAHLRYCRALDFHSGQCPVGQFRLRINEEEGLVIE